MGPRAFWLAHRTAPLGRRAGCSSSSRMKNLTQDGGTRMKRLGGVLFALTLFVPMAAQAQTRPSNTMQTRSAELYVDRARRTTAEAEKKKLLEQALGFALEGIKTRADNPKAY